MQDAKDLLFRPIHFDALCVDDLDFDILQPGLEKADEFLDFVSQNPVFTLSIRSRTTEIPNAVNEDGLAQLPEVIVSIRQMLAAHIGNEQGMTPGIQHPIEVPAYRRPQKS
jgi:hypothetical protein